MAFKSSVIAAIGRNEHHQPPFEVRLEQLRSDERDGRAAQCAARRECEEIRGEIARMGPPPRELAVAQQADAEHGREIEREKRPKTDADLWRFDGGVRVGNR